VGGPRTHQQVAAQRRLQQTQAQVDEVRSTFPCFLFPEISTCHLSSTFIKIKFQDNAAAAVVADHNHNHIMNTLFLFYHTISQVSISTIVHSFPFHLKDKPVDNQQFAFP